MNAAVRLPVLCIGLGLLATQSIASTRVGIYAIIDDVAFEPSDFEPERALISGVFIVPVPISSGLHRPPSRGYLYFSINHDAPNSTRADWRALRETAGTSRVVGFGQYWMSCANARSALLPNLPADANCSLEVRVYTDPTTAIPEPYPTPNVEGVITEFDDDTCARFGKPSVQIAFDLREAHSPGIVQDEPRVCAQQIGLVSSSSLDSAFVAQTRDPEWAEATETYVLQRLAEAPGLELSDLRVECRDTLCHIRLVFPTREYQDATGNSLAADALNELPVFAPGGKIIPPGGEPTMDYYFQRRRVPFSEATR
jgi:hypothetical protein